ncbi:hypothetical protein V6N13_088448 [Hibiscus sabdariffa]|uniref:Uncharacterized protein n=1 Tax=Hibiscus sabdariffa TaxID=183260 RepID=A0ABR2FZS6_9ROSI
MVKLTPDTKLQHGYWLRYLPPTTLVGSSRPQGRIHYNATNFPANPPTPTLGTKLAALGKESIMESVHSSYGASAANDANLTSELPDPLDDFLNEADFSAALDVLAPTPLMVVKPNGETIVEGSPVIRTNSIASESTISPTAPIQHGTKRRSPMVAASKAKKTRTTNPTSNVKAGMSSKNSPEVVDIQPRRGT